MGILNRLGLVKRTTLDELIGQTTLIKRENQTLRDTVEAMRGEVGAAREVMRVLEDRQALALRVLAGQEGITDDQLEHRTLVMRRLFPPNPNQETIPYAAD